MQDITIPYLGNTSLVPQRRRKVLEREVADLVLVKGFWGLRFWVAGNGTIEMEKGNLISTFKKVKRKLQTNVSLYR